ncbi:hypothetical protein GCM10027610_013250 [Dactylosporangium cerinum]
MLPGEFRARLADRDGSRRPVYLSAGLRVGVWEPAFYRRHIGQGGTSIMGLSAGQLVAHSAASSHRRYHAANVTGIDSPGPCCIGAR